MEIIERKAAQAKGLKTYFTGQPCKHGHVAQRYIKSGACSTCVKLANNQPVDPSSEARRAAAVSLIQAKVRLFKEDVDVFAAAAHAAALMRCPVLHMVDIWPGLLPLNVISGTGFYKFNCYSEDLDQLRALAITLTNARSANWRIERPKVLGSFNASVPVAPVPDWARVPQPGDPDWGM